MAVHAFSNTRSEAHFSSCGNFRFWLCREWGVKNPFGVFLLSNPSYADALRLDTTNMICSNLAVLWGWRGFGIVNIIPAVSTAPINSATVTSTIGAENDEWIIKSRSFSDVFVLAVGNDRHVEMQSAIKRLKLPGPFHSIDKKNAEGGYPHPSSFKDRGKYPQTPNMISGSP